MEATLHVKCFINKEDEEITKIDWRIDQYKI